MNKFEAYRRSLESSMAKYHIDESALDRCILYGIRVINVSEDITDAEGMLARFQLSELIFGLIAMTTPRRFTRIFPIEKKYDGKRWEIKDYFSTVEMIKNHGWDDPIRDPFDFLWDYENRETREFTVNYMGLISDLRRAQGHPGLLEEWAVANDIPLYTMHTDQNGKQFLVGEDGRSFPGQKETSTTSQTG